MNSEKMVTACLRAGVDGTSFYETVTRDLDAWSKIDGPVFRLFLQLARLESVAELVRFSPQYDPVGCLIKFQFYTDESLKGEVVDNTESMLVDADAIDAYKGYLLDALRADLPKIQHYFALEEELEAYYPEVAVLCGLH